MLPALDRNEAWAHEATGRPGHAAMTQLSEPPWVTITLHVVGGFGVRDDVAPAHR